ncbi:melanocortin receptor 5-like [Periplaneta americana]|uniref:melanocortin receptor 5-like n=1 Tax=Periplaneta americana TaxID=6978 RepID=UPI0037E72374
MPDWSTNDQPGVSTDNFTERNNFSLWNQDINESQINSSTTSNTGDDETIKTMYKYTVPALLVFCILSLAINVRILISIYWIRRPLSPTLHISLSLAGADAYTSLILALGLVVNSLLPVGLEITYQNHCFALFLETQRLGGVIVTVAHLLALACNHYLGILKPLHYLSIMTHRNTTVCIIFLWVVPIAYFVIYFSSVDGEGFQSENCTTIHFLVHLKFRAIFSSLFFGPLLLMFIIYMHIFSIVRQHQVNRLRFSQINHGSRHHNSNGNSSSSSSGPHNQQMARSVKAIHTTLFILGSFIVGWMPAVLSYLLLCEDCLFHHNNSFNKFVTFFIYTIVNLLIISKTLLNPIIYAARMHEIKMAIPRMHSTLCHCCCLRLADGDSESSERSQHSHHRMSQYYTSGNLLRCNTTIYRMHSCPTTASNGNPQAQELLQRKSTRGHYHHRRRKDDYSTDL